MKYWLEKNYKTLIIAAFLVPIITVAIVSISHVTKWYGISNPISWSIYLSIGIEIAALSALAAISANMGKKVYFPFAIVTIVQFIGNIYFAYSYIDVNSQSFKDWVGLVSPLVEFMGVDPNDFVGHKRFLAFFAGGMLPIISLSFLHMLVKFTEEDRMKQIENDIDKKIQDNVPTADIADEINRLKLSERDLEILENHLLNPNPPNEALKKAAEEYKKRGEILADMMQKDQELGLYDEPFNNPMVKEEKWNGVSQEVWDRMEAIEKQREAIHGPITEEDLPTGALANSGIRERLDAALYEANEEEISTIEPTIEEEEQNFSTIEPNMENIFQEEYIPSLSDEEIMEMNQDEYERNLEMEDSFDGFIPEPFATPEEVEKYGLDGFEPERVLPEIIEEPNEEIIINEEESEYWKDHIEPETSDDDLKKK